MSVREIINRNRNVAIAAAAGLAFIALAIGFYQPRPATTAITGGTLNRAWFSADDGKSWFADDAKKTPPFQKDGKEAYRVYVYRASDGTQFVSHLEGYTAAGKRALEAAAGPSGNALLEEPERALGGMILVKKPGQASWVQGSDSRAAEVRRPVSPKGQTEGLEPVYPQ